MAINLSQQRFLQPLRSNILGSYELAVSALTNVATEIAKKTDGTSEKADGSTIVARYTDNSVVKSIFGIYEHSTKKITIYSHDDEKLQGLLDGIDGRLDVIQGESNVEGSIKKAVADVVNGATEGYRTLSELETKIKALDDAVGEGGSVSTQIQNAIDLLDSTATSTNGQLINITVVEENGKLSSASVDESGLNTRIEAIEKSVSDEQTRAKGVEEQLGKDIAAEATKAREEEGKLAKAIADVSDAAKSYSIVAITEGLSENVKEAFKLVDEDGVQAGATISIYKDSSLKEVKLDGQILNFTYILADGTESTVGVDVSTFLAESEFANGLQVNDHVVSVKIDAASEGFLTVSKDGIKLSGVQNAINKAKNDAIQAIDDADYLKNIKVNGVEGTVVEGSNIAEVTINGGDVDLSSEYVKAEYTDVAAAGLTPVADGSIEDAISTLEGNIVKLTKEVLDNEAVCAEAITKLNEELGFDENDEFKPCKGTYITNAESISEALCILDASLKSVSDTASGDLSAAVAELDATVTSDNGKFVNITVVEADGKLTDASVDETALSDKIAEIEKEIDDNKAASDASAAAAKTEVLGGTTNNMLKVTPSAEGANADGHTTYTVDLSNTWDCGTFEYKPDTV